MFEQHGFELLRSTYLWTFFNKYLVQYYTVRGWLNLLMQNWGYGGGS